MKDLKGKKIGLTKSLNTIKNDWWRIQEEQGIELMLMLNDMTRDDVEIVEFPYPDDWYDKPEMLAPMENPSELWLKRDHKHDLAFRPLETALENGVVDAIYTQSVVFQQAAGGDGQVHGDRGPVPVSGLAPAGGQRPRRDHVHRRDGRAASGARRHVHEGHDQGRPLGNENKHAAAAILDKQTFYLDAEDTYRHIKNVDMVPNLSPQNLAAIEIGKDFMLSHGYIENDFDVHEWAAPEFLEKAAEELLEEQWKKVTTIKLPEASELQMTTAGSASRSRNGLASAARPRRQGRNRRTR